MLFNSIPFLLFFAAFMLLWRFARARNNFRWTYLVTFSFIFYGWWDWRYLFLILASGFIDFVAALAMERRPKSKRLWLDLSLAGNLGILFTFKYLGFFTETLNSGLAWFGSSQSLPISNLVLPVGISFFTFQSMSYTIDVYFGRLKPTKNYLHFMSYISLFPQLVAGPIVRARDLLPALESYHEPSEQERWSAFRLIVLGFFKKMVIADNLAPLVDTAFNAPVSEGQFLYWWVIGTMFAAQIYCDFSGYTDIARGVGGIMGYQLPVNFNHPYVAIGFRDFWSRWHISLSRWFRDYLYIPLGGSRTAAVRSHVNMWITMVVSGIWHGAGWTFIVWGALHAFYLTLERIIPWPEKLKGGFLKMICGVAVTFALTTIAWIPFRAVSIGQVVDILKVMFTPAASALSNLRQLLGLEDLFPLFLLVVIEAVVLLRHRFAERLRPIAFLEPVAIALVILLCVELRGTGQAFVYFQF